MEFLAVGLSFGQSVRRSDRQFMEKIKQAGAELGQAQPQLGF